MGGDATFSGTSYQARMVAFVEVHILAQLRLGWLDPVDDTPLAIWCETAGPGDDIRIEFGDRHPAVEVQAKHGMTAGARLTGVADRLRSASTQESLTRVFLAVNRGSSRTIVRDVRRGLIRFRSGRLDSLGEEVDRLVAHLNPNPTILERLAIIPVDVDSVDESDAKSALLWLREHVLENGDQALAAWRVLADDANSMCSLKLRRTRKELVDLLEGAGLRVRHPTREDQWHRQLDATKALLERGYAAAALSNLRSLKDAVRQSGAEPLVSYRICAQIAAAHLQLDRYADALNAAREALDVDPNGFHALASGAYASMLLGNMDAARDYAGRAVEKHPEEAGAWAAALQVAAAAGQSSAAPPGDVTATAHYRIAVAQVASNSGSWSEVLEITSELLARSERSLEVLLLRSNALWMTVDSGQGSAADLEEIIRYTTEALDLVGDNPLPSAPSALTLRANALRRLSRDDESQRDLLRAQELSPTSSSVLYYTAQAKLARGDAVGAIDVLRQGAIAGNPVLLALRAMAEGEAGLLEQARSDLDSAEAELGEADDPDSARLAIAEAAIDLVDLDRATRLRQQIVDENRHPAQVALVDARLAFANGDVARGEEQYRHAATLDSNRNVDFMVELAAQLLRRGESSRAASVLFDVGLDAIPRSARPLYADALLRSENYLEGQRLVDRVTQEGSMPQWTLILATEIALRQEDTEQAIENLTALTASGGGGVNAQIQLAYCLLEVDRRQEAESYLDALSLQELTPTQEMQVAQMLQSLGRAEEAVRFAYRAFRRESSDPRIHRAFAAVVITSRLEPAEPTEVASETFVRMHAADGTAREVWIRDSEQVDPLRNELTLEQAQYEGLIGKRVGDFVGDQSAGWLERRWTIDEVQSSLVHTFQDVILHYGERFPSEPFFVQHFPVRDGSVDEFAPIIASAQGREGLVQAAFKIYRESGLPLGWVAQTLGGSVADVMDHVASETDSTGPLLVEQVLPGASEASYAIASRATEVVLTRSALKTLLDHDLGIGLTTLYHVVAPRSLRAEVKSEVVEAERQVREGRAVIASVGTLPVLHDVSAGDPTLEARLQSLRTVREWLDANVAFLPRPLTSLASGPDSESEARELLGRSSFDAVVLTESREATLYADDLGLRLYATRGERTKSFCTVALLAVLVENGRMSMEQRDDLLIALALRGHWPIPATASLLVRAIEPSRRLDQSQRDRLFSLLGLPSMALSESTRMAAEVIKSVAMAQVHVVTVGAIALEAMRGMARGWPRPLVANMLTRAATVELRLLPHELAEVANAAARFANAGP
jgi:tetratricopeptide (TPR) repeat protein